MGKSIEEMIEEMAVAFSRDINSAGKSLTVVSGEAVCYIYNHPKVSKSLLAAQKRGVQMRFMLSPIICVESPKKNTILDLMDEDNVEVYRRKGRALIHYRVMDCNRVYIEEPHLAAAGALERKSVPVKDNEQEFWAEKLEDEFDYLVEKGVAERVTRKEDLIPLFQGKIQELRAKVESKGMSFDFMDKHEIEKELVCC